MGGHGGLNILPQKRWNVYNYDARAKVEKDRRLQQEKNENLNKNKDEGQASSRYEFLKLQRHKKNIPEHKQEKSQINKELEDLSKNKHLNLFQDEEKINEIEATRNAKLEKEKKNLPYDESSKFLGTLDEKTNKPWYIDVKEKAPTKRYPIKREIISKNDREYYNIIKDFQIDSSKFYKLIDGPFIEKKKAESNKALDPEKDEILKEKEKHHNQKHHHNKEKHKKYKKSRSRSRAKSKEGEDKIDKKEKIEKLREERLRRETEEKKKVLQLLTKISG